MDNSSALWAFAVTSAGVIYYALRVATKQSITSAINFVADKQLEQLKSELTTRIECIRHEYQLTQLKTSLFFEHQRTTFAEILAQIADVKEEWFNSGWEEYVGITAPVPQKQYKKLLNTYYKNQLFLDGDCLAAVELILDALRKSFPRDDGSGNMLPQDCDAAYERLEYLHPRIIEIFQEKLGFTTSGQAKKEMALFGAILLLNSFSFRDIDLLDKDTLQLTARYRPAEVVAKAEENRYKVVEKLKEFQAYLRSGRSGVGCYAVTDISRYLAILEAIGSREN